MALPNTNGVFIHKGYNCSPTVIPTAQSIPMSSTDATSVKTKIDDLEEEATITSAGLMSASDKTKLNGIESGAEVNVQSDWNATSGDALILNKPTLGSAASKNVSTSVTSGDPNLVTSGAVYTSLNSKMDKTNPTGTGSLSINRKADTTVGEYSAVTGLNNEASGNYTHSEGRDNVSSASFAHSEGRYTTASNQYTHAEGYQTTASGAAAHAEGSGTTASGLGSHCEGFQNTASGDYSHAEGYFTEATRRSQHVFGEFSILDTQGSDGTVKGKYIEIVGNGAGASTRSNARTLDWNGNETLAGNLTYNGDVSLSRLLNAYSFSSASALNINVGRYCSIIIMGFAQGIGAVAILLTVTGSSITNIINMVTGAAWSNAHLTFSLSNNVLTVTSDSTSISNLTFIYGGN